MMLQRVIGGPGPCGGDLPADGRCRRGPARIHPALAAWGAVFASMIAAQVALAQVEAVVEIDRPVTTYEPPNNGAGPTWCYGSTCVVHDGPNAYVSTMETGKDVPPLCNTRWQLYKCDQSGCEQVQHEQRFRQREPCPLALLDGQRLFMSVNPSTQPPGVKYGPCEPQVLQFDLKQPAAAPDVEPPAFAEGTYFTDHSYRGFAADRPVGELILLNINAKTGAYFVSHRDRQGAWHARGTVQFPIRACYPQIFLKNGAVHVLAIGDIVEPVEAWRKLKEEKTGQKWDYVFRRLFYTFTPNVRSRPFIEPIEVDTVEKTCGHITNLDLYVDEQDVVHVLYLLRPYANPHVHDAYFPDAPMTVRLEHMTLKDGKILARRTLAETVPAGQRGLTPGWGRFHVAPQGRLYVVAYGTFTDAAGQHQVGNFIAPVPPVPDRCAFTRIDLKHPFQNFFTNTPRGGSEPSEVIDLYGTTDEPNVLRYARIRLK